MIALISKTPEILAWSVGWQEVIFVLVVVLLLFGGKKLPELARSLARGLKAFKHEIKDVKNELTDDSAEADAQTKSEEEKPAENNDTKDT